MSDQKFYPGDRVFAKVRGNPLWPARILTVVDKTPNKFKYQVCFYGTNKTLVCKEENLLLYVQNRVKYGKPMKKAKVFNKALAEIDAELGLSPLVYPLETLKNDAGSEKVSSYVDSGKKSKSSENGPSPAIGDRPKLTEIERQVMRQNAKKKTREILKTEASLLEIDDQIKSSLKIEGPQPEAALKYMDDFLKINITPLMLKKNPGIVDTIKKIRKYSGDMTMWGRPITDDEAIAFKIQAAAIREKSKIIFEKIKSLFLTEDLFWEIYGKEVQKFKDSVKGMNDDLVMRLVRDPVLDMEVEG